VAVRELIGRSVRVVYVGGRRLVRTQYGRGRYRYVVNLPIGMNELWDEVWRRRLKVNVYIEIQEAGGPEL